MYDYSIGFFRNFYSFVMFDSGIFVDVASNNSGFSVLMMNVVVFVKFQLGIMICIRF